MIDANHHEPPTQPADPVERAGIDPADALDDLEADLAAVQGALESLDRITSSQSEGSSAAEIEAVVSPERFSVGADPQI